MHWWSFVFGAIAGGVVMTLVTFVFFAEQLAPWIKWKEQVMQKEMALAELRMAGKLNEQGHKRSEFRSEL